MKKSGSASRRLEIPALAALSLLPFASALANPGHILGTRDALRSFLPARVFECVNLFVHGTIPRWNPLIAGGIEFRADLGLALFDPLGAVFALFGPQGISYGFSWYLALHLPLAFLAMLVFLRAFRIQRSTSLLFAFAYAVSAFLVSTTNAPNITAALSLLPLYLGCMRAFARERAPAAAVGAAGALAWVVYSGSPDLAVFAALATPFLLWRWWNRPAALVSFAAVGLGALALTLPIVLPFVEIVSHSTRVEMSFEEIVKDSVHLLRLPELFLPGLWGNLAPNYNYAGKWLLGGAFDFPLIFSLYAGFFLPVLTAIAVFRRRFRGVAAPVLLAVLVPVVLSLGSHGGLYVLLARFIPFWRSFRYPEKWLALAVPPLFLLAGRGFQRLRAWLRARRAESRSGRALFVLLAAPAAAALVAAAAVGGAPTVRQALLRYAALELAFTALVWISSRGRVSPRVFFWAAFLLIGGDLVADSSRYVWDEPATLLSNPAAEAILADLDRREAEVRAGGAYRLYRDGDYAPVDQGFVPGDLDFVGRTIWVSAKNFVPNTPSLYGLSNIAVYSGLVDGDRQRWWMNLARGHVDRLLSLMGAYYIVKDLPEIGFRRNTAALPFISAVKEAERVGTFDDALARLRDPGWDPARSVVIEAAALPEFSREAPALEVERGTDEIRIRAVRGGEGGRSLLLVNESYRPRWECEPDCEVVGRANGWAIAVLVKRWNPAGITLRYR